MPVRKITRRRALKTFGIGAAGVFAEFTIPGFAVAQSSSDFSNELKIPQLLTGTESDSQKTYELNIRKGESQFFPNIVTPTLGINGDYLGPTIRFRDGDNVQMLVSNAIGQRSAIHWHGLHVPPSCDGGPTQTIPNGGTWKPTFEIIQKAGTYWYHSHMLHKTGEQVYHGMAGMIIVDDEECENLNLPSTYGVDDIPLIVQDRAFRRDGSFRFISHYGDIIKGMHGDTILVNGTASPYFSAASKKVRFRILNAANSRTFNFAFSDKRAFHLIASDGGFLEQPVEMENMILAPAERAEIIVDLSDGKNVTLVSLPKDPDYPEYPGGMSTLMREMNSEGFDILAIRPQANLKDIGEIPSQLTHIEKLREEDSVKTRLIKLVMGHGARSGDELGPGTGNRDGSGGGFGGGNFSINGRHMSATYVNEKVNLGDTEVWELINQSPMMHPFHIHDIQFQILSRNGKPPEPHEQGLKDTVCVHSEEKVRIIMRFEDFADAEVPYMFHCHNLEHEDRGMMGQFLVI